MADNILVGGSGGSGSTGSGVLKQVSDLSHESPGEFNLLKSSYKEKVAFGIKEGGVADKKIGTPSIFNPFQIFRYSKFGTSDTYDTKHHYDNSNSGVPDLISGAFNLLSQVGGNTAPQLKDMTSNFLTGDQLKNRGMSDIIENPSASQIINWSQKQATHNNIPIAPYALSDFLWCTHYGKIPNNRLITLRRYTLPVEDNLAINQKKMPLVPTAQAITWFGKDVGNPLSEILNLNWGFNWLSKTSEMKDVQGNEVPIENFAKLVSSDQAAQKKITQAITLMMADKSNMQELLGMDQKAQDWIKAAYTDDGPYWNRILGPVNVVDKTLIRNKGFAEQKDITLKFNYSLRSYNLINPKVAFLDLISNFLSLTYNTASWWGGGIRYFKKTGLTFSNIPGYSKLMDGDLGGAAQDALQQGSTNFTEGIGNLKEMLSGFTKGDASATAALEKLIIEKANVAGAGRIKESNILQMPLIMRQIATGQAVGEWHLSVGNPMNPIANIGNLCMSSASMKFIEDSLGIDDFPTEIEFTVTLKHGRIRAKQDIQSIFNLGNGALTRSPLITPSETQNANSLGENQAIRQNALNEGSDLSKVTGTNGQPVVSMSDSEKLAVDTNSSAYGARVSASYGKFFGESPIIKDYFTQLKTKD